MFPNCEITKDISRAKKFFENIVSYTVGPYTLSDMLENNKEAINLVDVREYNDYLDAHIPYAVHIPYKKICENLEILDKNKVTILYTYSDSCPRAYKSSLELLEKHYPAVVLRGGFREWKKSDLDTVKSNSEDYKD